MTGARQGGQAMEGMGRKATRAAQALNLVKIAATGLAVGAGYKLTQWARQSVAAATEQAQAYAQVEQAIESTGGAAQRTAEQLAELASDIQKVTTVGDEATLKMQSLLLTFKSIGGEVFDRTTRAIVDMSERMGSLESNALLLGKALDDPARRASELSRSGIVLTQTQQELIKSFEALGDRASAQNIILSEIESQFGGAAEAAANAAGGGLKQFNNALGDLQEEFGKGIVESLDSMSHHMATIAENGQAAESVRLLGEAVGGLLKILGGVVLALGEVQKAFDLMGKLVGEPIGRLLILFGLAERKLQDVAKAAELVVKQTDKFSGSSSEGSGIAGLGAAFKSLVEANVSAEMEQLATSLESVNAAVDSHKQNISELEAEYDAAIEAIDDFTDAENRLNEALSEDLSADQLAGALEGGVQEFAESLTEVLGGEMAGGDWIPDEPPPQWATFAEQMGEMLAWAIEAGIQGAVIAGARQLDEFLNGSGTFDLREAYVEAGASMGAAFGMAFGGPAGAAIGEVLGEFVAGLQYDFWSDVLSNIFGGGGSDPNRAIGSVAFGEKPGTVGGTSEAQEAANALLDQWNALLERLNGIFGDTLELTAQAIVTMQDSGKALLEVIDNATGEVLFSGAFDSFEEAFQAGLEQVFSTAIVNAEGPIAEALQQVLTNAVNIGAEAAMEQLETLAEIQGFLDEQGGTKGDPILEQIEGYRKAIEEMGLEAEIAADILAELAAVEAARTKELALQNQEKSINLFGRILDMAEQLGIDGVDFAKKRFELERQMMLIDIERFRIELQGAGLMTKYWSALLGEMEETIKNLEFSVPSVGGSLGGGVGGLGGGRRRGGGRGGRKQKRADFMDRLMGMLGRGAKDLNREFRDLLGNLADMFAEAKRLKLPLDQVRGVMRQIVREFGQQAFSGVSDFLTDLRGPGGMGGGTLREQFTAAQSAFQDTMRRAQAGDLNAVQDLPGAAQALLDLGQEMFGSTAQFNALVSMVESSLTSVMGQQNSILDKAAGQHQALLDSIGFQTNTLAEHQVEGNQIMGRQQRTLSSIERKLQTQTGLLDQIAASL